MKGQTHAVTAVILTAIIVGSVATAYYWGSDYIEEISGESKENRLESKAVELEKTIRKVSRSGSGNTEIISFSLGNGEIKFNPGDDYIDIIYGVEGSGYVSDNWVLIKGRNTDGLSYGNGDFGMNGVNYPGAVAFKKSSQSSRNMIRVEFRNLKLNKSYGYNLTKIDLISSGVETSSGDVSIEIKNNGSVDDSVTINGKNYLRNKRKVVIGIK